MGFNVYGDNLWDRGAPYRWNNYDIDPRFKDTDTDVPGAFNVACFDLMDDDWDPRPTIPDDRLDTIVGISYIKNTKTDSTYMIKYGQGAQQLVYAGSQFAAGQAPYPGNHDCFGLPTFIDDLALEKGVKYEMSLFIGIEACPPDSLPIRRGWYRPYNITIGWHNMSFGEDQMHYTGDDDFDGDGVPWGADQSMAGWMYTPDNADMPLITLSRSDLQADKVPVDLGLESLDCGALGGPPVNYFHHSGLELPFGNVSVDGSAYWSKITFYQMKFFFYIPEGCPSGFIFIDLVGEADENIHIFNTPDAFTGYPIMYN
jgi:hypothetical protein